MIVGLHGVSRSVVVVVAGREGECERGGCGEREREWEWGGGGTKSRQEGAGVQ
jgi:hypothetical protein